MFWCDYGVHEAFLALCLYGTEHSKHIGNSLKSVMNFWVDTFPEVYTTVWVTWVGTVGKVVSCLPSIAVYPQSVEVKAIKTDVMLIITSVNFWISSSCSKLLIYLWSCFHCHDDCKWGCWHIKYFKHCPPFSGLWVVAIIQYLVLLKAKRKKHSWICF